jgi:CheY-like chemotaxis protein
MNILVVEDDEDIRQTLELVLSTEGHQVQTAVDGADALEQMRGGIHPELIIVDMMMPRLDGEGMVREVRGDARFAKIPIVIISGHQNAREKAAELGVGLLVKPIEIDQLAETVQSATAKPAGE